MMAFVLFAQSGEISGKVTDENGEAVPFANVAIVANGKPTGVGTTTDFDGFYSIKPLNPGKYDVQFSSIGYAPVMQQGVVVKNDKTTYLDQKIGSTAEEIDVVEIIRYKVPLIDAGETSSQQTMTSEDIENLATRDVTDIASTTAGVQKDADGELSIRGSRADGVVYYVDGIRVNGKVNLPVNAVEQIDVVAGGIPARYGEATGGVINISTKGGAREFTGGIEILESLDQWRYDLVSLNLAGPIIKKGKGTDDEKTILGFALSAEYNHRLDPRPSAVGMYKLKDSVLTSLQNTPLYMEDGIIRYGAENVTFNDLEKTRINPNVRRHDGRLNLRFDIHLNDDMKISLGGNGNYAYYHRRVDRYSLFNAENNPLNQDLNYRTFARFTHNIRKKAKDGEETVEKGVLQNGYYSVQVGYEKYQRFYEDDSHGRKNPFAYGYIGQFIVERSPVYGTDAGTYKLTSYKDANLLFKPGTENEFGAAFTKTYYELLGATQDENGFYRAPDGVVESINSIDASKALRNGERADLAYNLWYNTGRQYNGMGIDNDNDQFSASFDGGFDILKKGSEDRNKHAITFGLAFEQRISRKYTVSPLGLWDIARQNVNSHLTLNEEERWLVENGDTTLVIEGVTDVYPADTIFHYRMVDPDKKQSTFDKNLREKLGISATEYIGLDALPLDKLSIDLFSADELLNEGSERVFYRGYDVHGNKVSSKVHFEDFWNAEDADGNKTRPIAPFTPTYMAGYIEDKFQLKDLTFRLGLRVDRYDANQSVLKDPYSIVGSQTVGEARNKVTGEIPSNIGDDYVIYVDGQENPKVLGFRNGDTWYNTEGVEVRSVSSIAGSLKPLLPEGQAEAPNAEGFRPDLAFDKYKAQYNIMPRLQFSFNISENALFFSHFDILSQSPQSRIRESFFTNRSIGNPTDYYFFSERGSFPIANPNLKSETTMDFQIGFKQKLTKRSALTFAAYFKNFKDQIQVRKYEGVYPNPGEYYSYDNVDFGTTKGFEFGYDLRRTNNFKLNFNYTLQFADGTGSDDRTQLQVVQNAQGNFRSVNALDFDSRHSFNVVMDYRFGSGEEYNGPKTKKGGEILSNFGVNLLTQIRSGTPYTQQEGPSAERDVNPGRVNAIGQINGSRIGWNFNMDLKINKSFDVALNAKKAKENDDVKLKTLNFDVYLRIDNILGLANVVDVYRYTGSAEDDGWLGSALGQQTVSTRTNPQSYEDLYKAGLNSQNHYSLPRRIFLGASVYF